MKSQNDNKHGFKARGVFKALFLILAAMVLISCSNPGEKLKTEGVWLTNGEQYETENGVLKGSFLLQNGNEIRNGKIALGAFFMKPEGAYPIGNEINVLKTAKKLDVSVTLLQDKNSGEWLATQGWIGLKDGKSFLLENTHVKVIGGEDKPIVINGKSYANTDLIAKM